MVAQITTNFTKYLSSNGEITNNRLYILEYNTCFSVKTIESRTLYTFAYKHPCNTRDQRNNTRVSWYHDFWKDQSMKQWSYGNLHHYGAILWIICQHGCFFNSGLPREISASIVCLLVWTIKNNIGKF